jgi:hypothetical protein
MRGLIEIVRDRTRSVPADRDVSWVLEDLGHIEAALAKGSVPAWMGSKFGVDAARNIDVGPPGSPLALLAEAMYELSNALRTEFGPP